MDNYLCNSSSVTQLYDREEATHIVCTQTTQQYSSQRQCLHLGPTTGRETSCEDSVVLENLIATLCNQYNTRQNNS